MEIAVIFLIVICVLVAISLFFAFLFTAFEHYFALVFYRPFFVHFYFRLKTLSANQANVLRREFPYYQTLSARKKRYFEHRVCRFINRYGFVGRNDMIIDDRVRVLIAAASTMLTFGMRSYLYDVITTVLVYPYQYKSPHSEDYHKGEFNPRAKLIVFSWEDFVSGFADGSDNINLGIHEFAHVLHFQSLKERDISAIIFKRMFDRITREVHHPPNQERLINSDYFRIYAYTNKFEFLAVLIEHFFESPASFKAEFPEMYNNVSKMLNFHPVLKVPKASFSSR